MNIRNRIGEQKKCSASGEAYHAYIPKPLPPAPALELSALYPLLDKANNLLGQLETMGRVLPDHHLFLYMHIRKEAVLSSQIEGTQSSLSDLLRYENNQKLDINETDITEVVNYIAAMTLGLDKLADNFPLCLRLLKEMHATLLRHGRGAGKQPGEFRKSQNWIGGTKPGNAYFVPPPPEALPGLLRDLEKFIHDDSLPTLVKAALVHLQFESLHPFLDGNGRLGRLLITLILCHDALLSKPLLYLSLYFKTHRSVYYAQLQNVRDTGDWESWLTFFLEGVIETSQQAINTMQSVETLFLSDKDKIYGIGKSNISTMTAYQYLQQHPIVDAKTLEQNCQMTLPTALKALTTLENLGIAKETSGKKRNKIYQYQRYLQILENAGTNLRPIDTA